MSDHTDVSSLGDVVALFEDWLTDRTIRGILEWGEEVPLLLCSVEGQFDYCDIGDHGPDHPKSFDFFWRSEHQEGQQISILLDEEDIEINMEEDSIEIQSGSFSLSLTRVDSE